MKKILFILLIPFSLFSQVTDKVKLRNGTTFYEESIQNILSNSFEDGQGLEWEANPIGLSKYNLGFPILHSGDDILVDRYIRFAPNTSLKFYTTEPNPLVSQFSITNDLFSDGYATIHLNSNYFSQPVSNRISAHGGVFDIVAGRDMQIETSNNNLGQIQFDAFVLKTRPTTKQVVWYGSQSSTLSSGSRYFSIEPTATTLSGLATDNAITEVVAIDPTDNKLYRKSISSILTSASGATTNTITPVGTNSFYTTVNGVNSNTYNVIQGLSLNYNGATTNNLAVTVNGNTSTTTIPTYTAGSGIGISSGVITNTSINTDNQRLTKPTSGTIKLTQLGGASDYIYIDSTSTAASGTFTPTISKIPSGSTAVVNVSGGLASYTKIGKVVSVNIVFFVNEFSSGTTILNLDISNLPFPINPSAIPQPNGMFVFYEDSTPATARAGAIINLSPSTTTVRMRVALTSGLYGNCNANFTYQTN